MKRFFKYIALALSMLFFTAAFQQIKAQDLSISSNLVFELKEGFSLCFDAQKVYLRPHIVIDATEGTASVMAKLVNEKDEELISIASVKYSGTSVGERNQLLNYEELNNFQKSVGEINRAMGNIDTQIDIAQKLPNSEETITALENLYSTYAEKLLPFVQDPVFAEWTYDNTFSNFKNDYFDWTSQTLTENGIDNLLSTFISVPQDFVEEDSDPTSDLYKYGKLSDYFNTEPVDKSFTATGDYFIEGTACYVLGEGQKLEVKNRLPNKTYTVSRSSCIGRTNVNGDAVIIIGNVISSSGVSYNNGQYIIENESFEINVKDDFTMIKNDDGQFMVFQIESN